MTTFELPIASDQDLVYSETNNFLRLLRIIGRVDEHEREPMMHYMCGDGQFVKYCRQNGHRMEGFDMRTSWKRKVKPESILTMIVVNLFDDIRKLEKHLPYMTEMLAFGGALIIENPFYEDSITGVKIGLPLVETLAFMQTRGYVHQFDITMNMPLFANKNNGTKTRRR